MNAVQMYPTRRTP